MDCSASEHSSDPNSSGVEWEAGHNENESSHDESVTFDPLNSLTNNIKPSRKRKKNEQNWKQNMRKEKRGLLAKVIKHAKVQHEIQELSKI